MENYKFLRRARVIFKVLAWIVLALGVIIGIIVLITGGTAPTGALMPDGTPVPATPKAAGLVFMIMGILYFLILRTISEVIGVLLDIKACCRPQSTPQA